MTIVVSKNSAGILWLICFLASSALVSGCFRSEPLDTACADGAIAVKEQNYERAMNIWAEASVDASAKMRLKAILDCMASTGLSKSERASASWIIARAEEGSVQAKLFAGLLYGSGVGVDADTEVAANWLDEATAGGSEAAAYIGEKLRGVSEE